MAESQFKYFVIDSMRPKDWEFVRAIYLEGSATGQATFEIESPDWERVGTPATWRNADW